METFISDCARDVIFVVDDSTTMSLVFSNVKQFMAELVSKLEIGPIDVMVSVVTYDVLAHNKWNLNRYFIFYATAMIDWWHILFTQSVCLLVCLQKLLHGPYLLICKTYSIHISHEYTL